MITDLITVVYTYHCVDNFKLKKDMSCHQDIYLQVNHVYGTATFFLA